MSERRQHDVARQSAAGRQALALSPAQADGTDVAARTRVLGMLFAALLGAAGLASLAVGDVLAETVYRYEEKGQTVYQDRAPASTQDNGHAVLNNQGVVLQQVLSRQDRRSQRQQARQRELARIRDRALLATFTAEEDLVRTRDDRIGMIDGLISRLDDRIRILSDRLAIVDKRVQMQEKSMGEGSAQASLYSEQQSIQRNIENAWSLIDSKAAERGELNDKFEDDLARYRELKAIR